MSKKVSTRWIEVDAGEGQRYDAYLALPPAGRVARVPLGK